jgi:hypothetical protein
VSQVIISVWNLRPGDRVVRLMPSEATVEIVPEKRSIRIGELVFEVYTDERVLAGDDGVIIGDEVRDVGDLMALIRQRYALKSASAV